MLIGINLLETNLFSRRVLWTKERLGYHCYSYELEKFINEKLVLTKEGKVVTSTFMNRRVIINLLLFAHVTPILKELHWLPIEQRVSFKVLLLAYEGLYGLVPKHLSDMLVRYIPCRILRYRDKYLLTL